MSDRQIHWVSKSSDKKIGKVLCSYSPKSSCPDSCSLKEGGCYAWGLFYLRNLSRDIASGIRRKTLQTALKEKAKDCKIARHRVAGDSVGDQKGTLEECKIIEKNGLTNIGYTHDWRSKPTQILKEYFRASCQNIEEVYEAKEKGWASTVIVPKGTENKIKLEKGLTAVMCPVVKAENKIKKEIDDLVSKKTFESKSQRRSFISEKKKEMTKEMTKKLNCNSCTLCKVTDKTKDIVVMFEVHGSAETIKKATGKVS